MMFATTNRLAKLGIAVLAGWLVSTQASAQQPNGYPVTNVNLRAGPGTEYPVLVTVPARSPIAILGCLPDYGWCDSIFQGNRGWMRSIYLSGWYQGNYYALRDYAPRMGYRTVTFDIEGYWGKNYRNRPFYGERTRWTQPREEGYVQTSAFYNRLSPHGNWTWIQGQYVWVPGGVDRGWRPYTRGRWVYTNRGWTWVSNEPFGWATYHYGRWGFSNRVGWFWVPGNRWAPAWVSWRQGDDHLAWAPLPPSYDEGININISIGNAVPDYYWQVVPSRAFLSRDLDRQIVRDRNQYRPIIERTRLIGNTTIVNNTVVNNVVNVNYVEQQTQERVVERKIAVTDNAKEAGKVEGDAVEVYQPAVAEVSDPKELAPPEPKKIEDLAEESSTKEQGEGQPATDEMLLPPEIKKAEETAPKAGEGVPAGLPEALPAGKTTSGPPPESDAPPPAAPVAAEDLTPAGPDADSSAPAKPAEGSEALTPSEQTAPAPPPAEGPPPEADEVKPKTAKPKGKGATPDGLPPMVPMEDAPPPPPGEKAAPPSASEGSGPPAADGTPPAVDSSPSAPQNSKPEVAKPKSKGQTEDGLPPMVPMDDAPPPPPGASEDAPPPPPAMDEPGGPPAADVPTLKPQKGKKAKGDAAPPPPAGASEDAPLPPPAMDEQGGPPASDVPTLKPQKGKKAKGDDAPPPPPAVDEPAPPPPPPVQEEAVPPPPAAMDDPEPRKGGKEGKPKKAKGNGGEGPPPVMEDMAPPPGAEDMPPPPPLAEDPAPKQKQSKAKEDDKPRKESKAKSPDNRQEQSKAKPDESMPDMEPAAASAARDDTPQEGKQPDRGEEGGGKKGKDAKKKDKEKKDEGDE